MSCFVSFESNLVAEQIDTQEVVKVYVSPEQIVLTEGGIFLLGERGVQFICFLGVDEMGLYTTQIENNRGSDRGTLCGHGYGCRKCGGCIQPSCWNYCSGCN